MHTLYIDNNEYRIKNPIEIVRAFWVFDGSFLSYDLADGSTLEKAIKAAPKLGARIKEQTLLMSISIPIRKRIDAEIEKYLK